MTTDKMTKLADKAKQRTERRVMQAPLPLWPEDRRGAPNTLIRSALFKATMFRTGNDERERLHKHALDAVAGYTIRYTGEVLDQRDLDTWLAVTHLFRERGATDTILVSGNELLKLQNLADCGSNLAALKARLWRMMDTVLDVEPDNPAKHSSFHGSMVGEFIRGPEGRLWEISLSPRVLLLFKDGHTWIDWKVRHALRDSPLAQWLHAFYRSHAAPFNVTIPLLHRLSGSDTKELRYFRAGVKKAMRRLDEACRQHGVAFSWDYDKRTDKLDVRWEAPRSLIKED